MFELTTQITESKIYLLQRTCSASVFQTFRTVEIQESLQKQTFPVSESSLYKLCCIIK